MANRYWVGNSGNWNDTAHWSLSSGGAGGASEPVAGDTAVFDLNSGSYNFTVQIHSGTNAQCNFVISNTHVAFEVLGELSLSNNIEYLRGLTINGGTLTTNNYNIYVYDWIWFVFDYSAYLGSSTITFAGSLSFTEVEGFNYICSASSAKFVATLDNPAPMNGHYIDVQSDIELGEFSITTNHTNTFYIIGNTSFSKVTLTGSGPVTTSFNQPYTTTIRMPGGLTLIGEPQSSWLTLSNANFSMASGSCDAHNIIMLGCTASGGAIFNAFTSNGNIDGGGNDGWDFGVRYWVGNGGNWSNTDHWSHSSGGAGGVSVPTEDHNVYFDDNSFTLSNQTVLIDEDINVKTFDVSLYNESINGLTIDFNSKNVNCLELDIFSYSPIIIDLSNAFVNGEFAFGYNSLNALDLLNITNCTFTVPMFNVFNMGEDYFPYQLNITSLNYIFTEDVLQINLNTDIDIYIENLNIINLKEYPPIEENSFEPSNELYWTVDGQNNPAGSSTITIRKMNFGWDVRKQDFIKNGNYSWTLYNEIPFSPPYSFTIEEGETFVKERLLMIPGAEWITLQKVSGSPQINEYTVSDDGVFTFNEGNAGSGVLFDYVYTIEPEDIHDSTTCVFNFDVLYQYRYNLYITRYDAEVILEEQEDFIGAVINISKPGEYLLHSVTINTPETLITGNLYLNNFYSDGEPTGENNIVTGNGVDWNIISYADYISISNTTLSDSNASGSTFYAYYSNGNIDGGNNTVWIFEDVMHITDFYPNMGTYGTEITITGISFPETPMVTFGGVPAVVDSSTSTQIITHVPIGAITGPITVDDYVSVTPFTVLTPIIENITPLHGPVRTVITITGSNFYKEPVITFHNGIVATIDSWNENQIITSVPFGTTTGPLTINFDDILYETTFTLGWSIVCSHGIINVKLTKIYSSDAYGGAEFRSYISNGCFDGGNNTGWIFDGYDPTEHKRRTQDPLTKYQITIIDITGTSGS